MCNPEFLTTVGTLKVCENLGPVQLMHTVLRLSAPEKTGISGAPWRHMSKSIRLVVSPSAGDIKDDI